ncbi:nucleolar protein,Nop52-domain-containing protein [Lipomyces oligophaga]|uniref:nucleolar protein,Nop52-domain-containing protein n=1 Tax=Lipomyces oligophaga TaxID=45792 RepID=UPI0034CF2411
MDADHEEQEAYGLADIIKHLAANKVARPTRESGVEQLSAFLKTDEEISELDMLKIWKGLYYTMWMTDRPKVQQAMANRLASLLLDCSLQVNTTRFLNAFWATITRDWRSIDVLRIDKYYLLIRRYVSVMFEKLIESDWNSTLLIQFNEILIRYPLNPKDTSIADGIRYHMIDIYIDELERTLSEHSIPQPAPMAVLLKPFENLVLTALSKVVRKRAFDEVLMDKRLSRSGYISPITQVQRKAKDGKPVTLYELHDHSSLFVKQHKRSKTD